MLKPSKLTIITFIISVVVSAYTVYLLEQYSFQQKKMSIQKLASSYVSHIDNNINYALSSTYAIAALIRTQKGDVSGFTQMATEMLDLYPGVASLQLHPDGILKHAVPVDVNKIAIGHNLFLNEKRSKEAFLAKQTGKLTLAGPFELLQGGVGAAARLPIYLDTDDGEKFWGFATAVIRFPEILNSIDLESLPELGIGYQLTRIHPDTDDIQIIASSNTQLMNDTETFVIAVPNGHWTFLVYPLDGWRNSLMLSIRTVFAVLVVCLATFMAVLFGRIKRSNLELEKTVLKRTQELKNNLKRLSDSEKSLHLSQRAGGVGTWEWDLTRNEVVYSEQVSELMGKPQEVLNKSSSAFISSVHPDDREKITAAFDSAVKAAQGFNLDHRVIWPDGSIHWLNEKGNVIADTNGRAVKVLGVAIDITERKIAEEKLLLSARVFNDTHEGIIITDADKLIVDVNPAFFEITGYSREDVIGENPGILSSGRQGAQFYADMWQTINEVGHWQGEVWNRKKDGEVYAESLTISSLTDDSGKVVNYVGVFTDITTNKKQQEKLSLLAHYDLLTGLPNRALFIDRFTQAIAHSKRTGNQLAICFLDLDNFKPINDNFGHDAGDRVLIKVAERITESVRAEDTVSRQGGDEFAILLNDIESYEQCEQALQRIHYELAQPYLVDNKTHHLTASSGITLYPDDDADIDTLLRHADQAMYQSKLAGKNRYRFFNLEHDQLTIQYNQRLEEIEKAFIDDQFQLYYQPKVNMGTGEVSGAEALLRWYHPENGIIPPLSFLPVIEGTALEIEVGDWVISEALSQLEVWAQQGIKLQVSVNISSRHLLSDAFFEHLESCLASYPAVDPSCFQLEILESSELSDIDTIVRIIESCQSQLGVSIALDDFGTGYSSLTHLRNLPVDIIKIDQSFIRDLLDDPDDYSITDGIIGLADSFGREVIAEGVETISHGLMLLMMGCQQAQGYGISKPMPAIEFPQWVKNYQPNQEWLRYASKLRSKKENKLTQLKLLVEQWRDKFINNIQVSPEHVTSWPVIDNEHCPCGTWLQRAEKEQLLPAETLDKLNQSHDTMHLVAKVLLDHYQSGNFGDAQKGLSEFKIAADQFVAVIPQFKS